MERTPDASEIIGSGAFGAIVHSAPEGGDWADVPELHVCYSQAETLDELVPNLQEAVEGWPEADTLRRHTPPSKSPASAHVRVADVRGTQTARRREMRQIQL